jgi:hypothetical protein
MPVEINEYPKWVDGVLIDSEDHAIELENQVEKDAMVKELKNTYGKEVDLRSYKGANGFGALRAYYEAVVTREKTNDNSSNNS